MMQFIDVAAVALNTTPMAWESNLQTLRQALIELRKDGAKVVCFPELSLTGYGCEDAFLSPSVQQQALESLKELIPETQGLVVAFGLPVMVSGALYNSIAVVADQRLLGWVAKGHLAGDGIHYEPRWFKPWPQGSVSSFRFDGEDYPIGHLVFDIDGVRIGFEICEDAWVASRPGEALSRSAVDIILNPSASHFAFGKQEVRRRLVLESSRSLGVAYVYANLLGNEAGRVIYDGHSMIASNGRMEVEGVRFSFKDFEVTRSSVDLDLIRMNRSRRVSYQPREATEELTVVSANLNLSHSIPQASVGKLEEWETKPCIKEEEFTRAVSLGLWDYLRKSRASGYVVSLSGGADSSAVATLVWALIKIGVSQLGREGFAKKLSHVRRLSSSQGLAEMVKALLATVYQATRNSSEATEVAAREVAEAIGSQHYELDVDGIVNSYVEKVSEQIGRDLNWDRDDLALQNIQARVRSPSVWLIANVRNAILLSTSNRSEAAVGYATMDGDTSGGLSPIAGIDKAFLKGWLQWMAKEGPLGVGNVEALEAVVRQVPTAELRPLEAEQTDEDDLMPYDILDWIERAAIRDKQGPVEIFQLMKVKFPRESGAQLADWVERFFQLWSRNQWKRERYAPSFHLDDENLDPKTWCRFPILSGGFELELREMRELATTGL